MAFDSVPWFVGGGAEHSPDVARLLAHIATGGAGGVGGVADLKVVQLPAATGTIRVSAGSCVIPNRYLGANPQQSYVARAPSVTDITVTPTGSASGRSDFVVVRIDDPQYGGAVPANPKVGPYVSASIIENVGAGATTLPGSILYPAVVLARIDLPANTATVTQALITDLRSLPAPRTERRLYLSQPPGPEVFTELGWGNFHTWPTAASRPERIPAWATRVSIVVTISSLMVQAGQVWGSMYAELGTLATPGLMYDIDQANYVGPASTTYILGGTLAIPEAMRGTVQPFRTRFDQSHNRTGSMSVQGYSLISTEFVFEEAPV